MACIGGKALFSTCSRARVSIIPGMRERLLGKFGSVPSEAEHVTLYTKPGCELCREAEHAVRRVFGRSRVQLVDISGRPELEDLYVFRIPVLSVRETVLAEGRITRAEALLARQRLVDLQRDAPGGR